MTATSNATRPVPRAALADLADRIGGRLLTPPDPGYRRRWTSPCSTSGAATARWTSVRRSGSEALK
jgi:hypothetical protein